MKGVPSPENFVDPGILPAELIAPWPTGVPP